MNIDIRNIDNEFEQGIKDIMKQHHISTATKATRFAVVNSLVMEQRIREQSKTIQTLIKKLDKEKSKLKDIKEALGVLKGI